MSTPEPIDVDGMEAHGYVVPLETVNLVFIKKGNSLLACAAVDVTALEKFDVPAAAIAGVASVSDLLEGEVKTVNKGAEARGVTTGMRGREALARL